MLFWCVLWFKNPQQSINHVLYQWNNDNAAYKNNKRNTVPYLKFYEHLMQCSNIFHLRAATLQELFCNKILFTFPLHCVLCRKQVAQRSSSKFKTSFIFHDDDQCRRLRHITSLLICMTMSIVCELISQSGFPKKLSKSPKNY